MKKPYQALIFDWDGTLADSTSMIVNAVQQAFVENDFAMPSDSEASHIIGLALPKAMQHLAPQANADEIFALSESYKRLFLNPDNQMRLFQDAQALLPSLKPDYWLTVATGKSRRGLDRALTEVGLDKGFFLATRTVDECASKPSPDMILSLCDELGLEPRDCLMIGDTTHDLNMAANAGCDAVALTCGAHDLATLQSAPHVAMLDNFRQLTDWLRA